MSYLPYFKLFAKILPLTYEEGISEEKQIKKIIRKIKELVELTQQDWGDIASSAQDGLDSYISALNTSRTTLSSEISTETSSLRTSINEETEARAQADNEIQEKINNAQNAPVELKPLKRKAAICGDGLMLGETGWGAFLENANVSVVTDISAITSDMTPAQQLEQIKAGTDTDLVTECCLIGDLKTMTGVDEWPALARAKFPNAKIFMADIEKGSLNTPANASTKAACENAGGLLISSLEGYLAESSISDEEAAARTGSLALGIKDFKPAECAATFTSYGDTLTGVAVYNTSRERIAIAEENPGDLVKTALEPYAEGLILSFPQQASSSNTPGYIEYNLTSDTSGHYIRQTYSNSQYTENTTDKYIFGLRGGEKYE